MATMKKQSIEAKAKLAAGRSKCIKCKFWKNGLCISPEVSTVCYENFVRGYIKGYKDAKKELRAEEYNKIVDECIFGELQDERIKKVLVKFMSGITEIEGTKRKAFITWIKKQKSSERDLPYGQRTECQDCQFNYAGHCKGYCELKRENQKPVKWSEEDRSTINKLFCFFSSYDVQALMTKEDYQEFISWLKSLKERM